MLIIYTGETALSRIFLAILQKVRNSKLSWFRRSASELTPYSLLLTAYCLLFYPGYPGSDALRRNRYLWALCAMEMWGGSAHQKKTAPALGRKAVDTQEPAT